MQRLAEIARFLCGDNARTQPRPGSAGLAIWVCLAGGLGMALGEWLDIRAFPVVRDVWRLNVHGVLMLAAALLWESAVSRRGRVLAAAGAAIALAPVWLRITHGRTAFETDWQPLVLCASASSVALLAAAWHGRLPLREWGLGAGDWRWWAPRTLAALVLISLGAVLAVLLFDSLATYYPRAREARSSLGGFAFVHLGVALDMIGWELLFRGFLLFGFARRGDPWLATIAQAIPFFLLHDDKPPVEIFLSLVGGILVGWFTLRARSVYPLMLLHTVQLTAVGAAAMLVRLLS
jgi:membrane protease YdiL (CAAX protease family)